MSTSPRDLPSRKAVWTLLLARDLSSHFYQEIHHQTLSKRSINFLKVLCYERSFITSCGERSVNFYKRSFMTKDLSSYFLKRDLSSLLTFDLEILHYEFCQEICHHTFELRDPSRHVQKRSSITKSAFVTKRSSITTLDSF